MKSICNDEGEDEGEVGKNDENKEAEIVNTSRRRKSLVILLQTCR